MACRARVRCRAPPRVTVCMRFCLPNTWLTVSSQQIHRSLQVGEERTVTCLRSPARAVRDVRIWLASAAACMPGATRTASGSRPAPRPDGRTRDRISPRRQGCGASRRGQSAPLLEWPHATGHAPLLQHERSQPASLLRLARTRVPASDAVVARARALERRGLRGLDAFHVASAEAGAADLLVTTDDRMLRSAGRASADLRVRVVSPPEAVSLLPRRPTR